MPGQVLSLKVLLERLGTRWGRVEMSVVNVRKSHRIIQRFYDSRPQLVRHLPLVAGFAKARCITLITLPDTNPEFIGHIAEH